MTRKRRYDAYTAKSKYELLPEESAAVTERLEKLVARGRTGAAEHSGADQPARDGAVQQRQPDFELERGGPGRAAGRQQPDDAHRAVGPARRAGEWLLPTNINQQLEGALGTADAALASANTNLTALAENLGRSLDNLANLTSNLNSQVQVNTNILGEISRAIVNADSFVQGLKHHWLLRSAFRTKDTNAPPAAPPDTSAPRKTRTNGSRRHFKPAGKPAHKRTAAYLGTAPRTARGHSCPQQLSTGKMAWDLAGARFL